MRIIELLLRTSMLEQMKEFYANRLGFPVKVQTKDSFTIYAGETSLSFVRDDGNVRPNYHFALNIPENQIVEAKEWLLRQGCPLLNAATMESLGIYASEDIVTFERTNAHGVYFEDPSGNLVELIARHSMKNSATEPFHISSILNISEIGFPLRNTVPEAIQELESRVDVKPYVGDKISFQMLGDDQGMFILVDTENKWYPTGRTPEIHPIHMTVAGDRNERFQLEPYPYFVQISITTRSTKQS
ncbi:VOC family protein [Paenibacillus chitinolyticus]|uniref:VOC family protein n=1 Tax=Paenibacillus chitinolyticus TaxID=79263 RepID=UPI00363F0B53